MDRKKFIAVAISAALGLSGAPVYASESAAFSDGEVQEYGAEEEKQEFQTDSQDPETDSFQDKMESDMSSTLKPDFAIIINKSKNFVSYETESMDIEKKSGKMIICGNFRVADGSEKGTEKDSFQIFNTLTFV